MEHEVFTKNVPDKPGRYIIRCNEFERLLTVVKKGPNDLIYEINGEVVDPDRFGIGTEFCRTISSNLAEECYAEGWHKAQYAAQKSIGSYFPSYWNDNTFSRKMAEGE